MQNVIAASVLTAGLRTTFADAYRLSTEARLERLRKVMELGVPSDKLTELYAYFETAPYPQRWPRGQSISTKPFDSKSFSVVNYDWAKRIAWHENDREDDQTRSLFDMAKSLGDHFATLHERIFFQMILAATDADLLPAIPNCPDGADLYNASDGSGADRFGVSGGNIVSGSGVASAQAIKTDVLNGIELFRRFQDVEGQPLWDDSMLDGGGYVLIYNVANDELVRTALKATTVLDRLKTDGTSTTDVSVASAAAPANIVVEEGLRIELWPTQRITTDDLYLFAVGSPHKAVFQQERRGLRETFANVENSDVSRDTKQEYIQFDARYGYGSFLPYQTVQIDNP
jgi:hypothetical protein